MRAFRVLVLVLAKGQGLTLKYYGQGSCQSVFGRFSRLWSLVGPVFLRQALLHRVPKKGSSFREPTICTPSMLRNAQQRARGGVGPAWRFMGS